MLWLNFKPPNFYTYMCKFLITTVICFFLKKWDRLYTPKREDMSLFVYHLLLVSNGCVAEDWGGDVVPSELGLVDGWLVFECENEWWWGDELVLVLVDGCLEVRTSGGEVMSCCYGVWILRHWCVGDAV
jgi:hypothetical protein